MMCERSKIETTQPNHSCVGPHDVLLGRGGATNNHGGNHNFRLLVAANQAEYLKARKHEKVFIARRIVAEVQSRGGKFLQSGFSKDRWEEVSDKRAQEKTSQALREGLDVRNSKLRPNKLIKAVKREYESSTQDKVNSATFTFAANDPHTTATRAVITPKVSPLNDREVRKEKHHGARTDNNLNIPSLRDESSAPPFLPYQRPPINKQEPKYACEV